MILVALLLVLAAAQVSHEPIIPRVVEVKVGR
jgi:hypothetical protein